MLLTNKNRLIEMLGAALQVIAHERGLGEAPQPRLERPKAVDHGDVACNIALQLSKAWKPVSYTHLTLPTKRIV